MIKALLSFSLGGLVVFVPQGAKTQERKPEKTQEVHVEVLQDVTEEAPKAVLTEAGIAVKTPGWIQVIPQDGKAHQAKAMDKAELFQLLERLNKMSVQVKDLDAQAQTIDRAFAKYQAYFVQGKNGLPDSFLTGPQKSKLQDLKRKMAEIAEMRDRLQAQIETTHRALAQGQSKKGKAGTGHFFGDGSAVIEEVPVEWKFEVERMASKKLAEVAKAKAQQAQREARRQVEIVRMQERELAQDKSARNQEVIRKLEREIQKLTREMQRIQIPRGTSTRSWSGTAPRPTTTPPNPFGVRSKRSPRSSGSTTTNRRTRTTRSTTYRRRPAPSTLGAEGKVIWNELQGIRSDIHALRQMLEKHIRSNAPNLRRAPAPKRSVGVGGGSSIRGPLRGTVVSPRGLPQPKGTSGLTDLGSAEYLIIESEDAKEGETGKSVRYWYTPKAPRAPVPPKAPKAGTGSHMIDILPIPRKGGPSIRYHEFELDTLGEPEKTKSDKKSQTNRRRSSISWPGSTDPTLVNQQRDSGIRRL